MNDMPMPELVKDPEFTDLIQPRDTQYMEEFEEDIFDTDVPTLYVYGTISL